MKREGRIHGANVVRVCPHQWAFREKGPSKPTNQSKCTAFAKHVFRSRDPSVDAITQHILLQKKLAEDETGMRSQKPLGKVKKAYKVKDVDITRNYLMQDWSIYERNQRVGDLEEEEEEEHYSGLDDVYECTCELCGIGSEVADACDGDELDPEEHHQSEARPSSQIVLPIESLLRERKTPPKASGVPQDPGYLSFLDGSDEIDMDSEVFESWWALNCSDGEDVPDGWFLVADAM